MGLYLLYIEHAHKYAARQRASDDYTLHTRTNASKYYAYLSVACAYALHTGVISSIHRSYNSAQKVHTHTLQPHKRSGRPEPSFSSCLVVDKDVWSWGRFLAVGCYNGMQQPLKRMESRSGLALSLCSGYNGAERAGDKVRWHMIMVYIYYTMLLVKCEFVAGFRGVGFLTEISSQQREREKHQNPTLGSKYWQSSLPRIIVSNCACGFCAKCVCVCVLYVTLWMRKHANAQHGK